MINSEDDVREWVRKGSQGEARWIEPALGSTTGLPDCWVPWAQINSHWRLNVHLELKVGEIKDGHLCYKVRPEQRREIRSLIRARVPVGLIVGVLGTYEKLFLVPRPEMIWGKVHVDDLQQFGREIVVEESFWSGVNFILSSGLQRC